MGAIELHVSIALGSGACCLGGSCIAGNQAACLAAGGTYQGDGTMCASIECPQGLRGDMNDDSVVNGEDIQLFINVLLGL